MVVMTAAGCRVIVIFIRPLTSPQGRHAANDCTDTAGNRAKDQKLCSKSPQDVKSGCTTHFENNRILNAPVLVGRDGTGQHKKTGQQGNRSHAAERNADAIEGAGDVFHDLTGADCGYVRKLTGDCRERGFFIFRPNMN